MNLTIYDILAHLIPGLLLYASYFYAQDISLDRIPAIPAAALAYIVGYLNSILASWSEGILYWSWGGKPSDRLLDGHGTWKVKMYDADKAKALLVAEVGKKNASHDELFDYAKRMAMAERESRL